MGGNQGLRARSDFEFFLKRVNLLLQSIIETSRFGGRVLTAVCWLTGSSEVKESFSRTPPLSKEETRRKFDNSFPISPTWFRPRELSVRHEYLDAI